MRAVTTICVLSLVAPAATLGTVDPAAASATPGGSGRATQAARGISPAVTLDAAAPAAPSAPDLDNGSDTGVSPTDNITSDTTPRIGGTATPGVTVQLVDGTVVIATVATNGGGRWRVDIGSGNALAEGTHTMVARAVDNLGNASADSPPLVLVIDTTAPPVPGVADLSTTSDSGSSSTDNVTNDSTPTFAGSTAAEDGTSVQLREGGGILGTAGVVSSTWSVTVTTPLTNGSHTVTATGIDLAGNLSAASAGLTITVDTIAPAGASTPDLGAGSDTGASSTDNITSSTSPAFSGTTSAPSGTAVELLEGATVVGTTTASAGGWTVTAGLGEGIHTLAARTVDLAGNAAAPSVGLQVQIDATAPAAPSAPDLDAASDSGSSSADGLTNDTTPTFTGTSPEPDGTIVRLLEGGVQRGSASVAGGAWTITASALTSEPHTLVARAEDVAGNTSGDSDPITITIDAVAPAVPSIPDLDAGSDTGIATDNITGDVTPAITGTSSEPAGTVVEVRDGTTVLGTTAVGGGAWTVTIGPLPDGPRTLTARTVDEAGNASGSSAGLAVTIDGTAPASSIALAAGQDSSTSSDTSIEFTVTFSEAVVGFTAGDVDLDASTVGGTLVATVTPVTATTYAVAVTGMAGTGDVTASVIAGAAADTAANPSTASGSATVTLVGNSPPDAVDDARTVGEDSGATALTVLSNDTVTPDTGEVLTITSATQPAHGDVAIIGGGAGLTYKPDANFYGPDTFTYTVGDGRGGSDTATVSVTVTNVNDPPTAGPDAATLAEDSAATPVGVLANDTYLPDPAETIVITAITQGSHGTVAITGAGSGLTYRPAANYNGPDSFTYTIGDGHGGVATATVAVTVTGVNDPPRGVNDSATVAEDSGATAIDVLANDSYLPDAPETLRVASVDVDPASAHGTVTITGSGTGLTFAPDADFAGPASFGYTVSDGRGGFATATVTVTVTAVNDAPTAVGDAASIQEGAPATVIPVLANDSPGPDAGDVLTILAIDVAPAHGVAAIQSGGTAITYRPAALYDGPDTLTYTVRDKGGLTATTSVAITVVRDTTPPSPKAPVVDFIAGTTLGSTSVPLKVSWGGSDAGSGVASYVVERNSTPPLAVASGFGAGGSGTRSGPVPTDGGSRLLATWAPQVAATTATQSLQLGYEHQYRIKASDGEGNVSDWVYSPRYRLMLLQQSTTAATYRGSWTTVRSSSASGGSVRRSRSAGSSVTFRFTGTDVALVAPLASTYGSLRVYVDGVYKGTISLRSSVSRVRRIVWRTSWSTSGTHSVRFVLVYSRTTSIDAFLLVRPYGP